MASTFEEPKVLSTSLNVNDLKDIFDPYIIWYSVYSGSDFSITFLSDIASFSAVEIEFTIFGREKVIPIAQTMLEYEFKNTNKINLLYDIVSKYYPELSILNNHIIQTRMDLRMHCCAYVKAIFTTKSEGSIIIYFIRRKYIGPKGIIFQLDANKLKDVIINKYRTIYNKTVFEFEGLQNIYSEYKNIKSNSENKVRKELEDYIYNLFDL